MGKDKKEAAGAVGTLDRVLGARSIKDLPLGNRFGAKEAENNETGHELEDSHHLPLRPARSWETLRQTLE